MFRRLVLPGLLFAIWAAGTAQAARVEVIPWWAFKEFRFQRGDDPRWAAKDFDDSSWQVVTGRELPARDGIYWIRWRVTQRDPNLFHTRDGVLLKVVASYDLYWDGELIGRNGRVSSVAEDEGPGVVDALFQIPRELLGVGEHVIALRMSSFNTGFPSPTYSLNFGWGNFRTMLVERSRTAIFSVMAVGAGLVVSIVFGLMWLLAGRRPAVGLFSALFLCVALMQALQAWRWLFEYPYNWHYPRLVVITALTTAMAVLLPAFVLEHFALRRRWWVYGPLAVFLTHAWFISPLYNRIGLHVSSVGISVALGVAFGAMWRRRRGAGVACAGLALSLLALAGAPRDFLDHAFFLSAGPAVLGLLVAVVLQMRDERREAQRAVLTAARLEIELLKKNIQPHFLLNTLATLQEVIEQDPRTAVALIDALAGEFRILSRVSGEKLIPLEQELELCRAHLRVMSLRKGARCTLEVSGIDGTAPVPPALFHTLIENGLTHLLPRAGRIEFELRAGQRPPMTRYSLLARGERQSTPTATTTRDPGSVANTQEGLPSVGTAKEGLPSAGSAKEGTGLRYIKARLEESFTGNWSVTAGPVPEGWETVIEIGNAKGRSFAQVKMSATLSQPSERPA